MQEGAVKKAVSNKLVFVIEYSGSELKMHIFKVNNDLTDLNL